MNGPNCLSLVPRYLTTVKWNAALWAEQGYVIVMPNIAGSVGYGLDFTSSESLPLGANGYVISILTRLIGVYESWGGAPYGDLVNLMRYLEELPYLDMDRAAIAGASYGGYLLSWIFGHDLVTKVRTNAPPPPPFLSDLITLLTFAKNLTPVVPLCHLA